MIVLALVETAWLFLLLSDHVSNGLLTRWASRELGGDCNEPLVLTVARVNASVRTEKTYELSVRGGASPIMVLSDKTMITVVSGYFN